MRQSLLLTCCLMISAGCPTGTGNDGGLSDGGPPDSGPSEPEPDPADSGCENCEDGGPSEIEVPAVWEEGHCDARWYGDGACDCGCLTDDLDCPAGYTGSDCAAVLCPSGLALDPEDPTLCIPPCGNGILDNGEACDDGNTTSGDGCTVDCTWEIPTAWFNTGCEAGSYGSHDGCDCGCGAPDPDCADGSITSCDHNRCDLSLDGPWVPAADDPTTCVLNACGDLYPGEVETCDDGNALSGDGCDSSCQVEDGYVCAPGACSLSYCGDGLVDPWAGELCDDGNANNADGCTSDCAVAPPGLDTPIPGSCEGRCEEWLGRTPNYDPGACFCDTNCASLGDCCSDLALTCRPSPPRCTTYCEEVLAACPASYPSFAACESTCQTTGWRLGEPGAQTGNSVACRHTWAIEAGQSDAGLADICAAAGPSGGDVCGALCDVFCDAVGNNCLGDHQAYNPAVDGGVSCAEGCALLAGGGTVGDTAGDTLLCRLSWAQLPADGNPELCIQASLLSPACTAPSSAPSDGGQADAGVSDGG